MTNKFRGLAIALILAILMPGTAQAALPNFTLTAQAAILMEQTTGKVLYAKDAHKKMYPASMTKILSALVTLEYLSPEEMVITGSEVDEVPYDSSKAGHVRGEVLSVENIIRGLIIPSGNETACVAAKAVVKKIRGVEDISYAEAEAEFCRLMNEKAKELGANNSNFVNPHGYHHDDHYSTAYDIALITRAGADNDLIRRISAEKEFVGNGAGNNPDPLDKTQTYTWPTHNKLIMPNDEHYYPNATGMKTGKTKEASDCVTATAEKDGRQLIAVVMYSPDPGRWIDAQTLFEYGFKNFADEIVQAKDDILAVEKISNSLLGESNELELAAEDDVTEYLSKEELARIQQAITIDPEYIAPPDEDNPDEQRLLAPITAGTDIATVTYSLDGEEIYSGRLLATRDIEERNIKTDIKYYADETKAVVFSWKAIPFWVGGCLVIFIGFRIFGMIKRKRRRVNRYKIRRRY